MSPALPLPAAGARRSLPAVGENERRRIAGADAIAAALARGERPRLVVVSAAAAEQARALTEAAAAAGVPVQVVGRRHFARLSPSAEEACAVALLADPADASTAAVMAREGPAWLLVGVAYPGNAGFAIRTAEVSGAAGVFLDCDFDHGRRREALRASMRADRFMPVQWLPAADALAAARAAVRRILAVEDVGAAPPWRTDLTGPLLLVVGGESQGVPEAVLAACESAIRIPMAGFIRSYNLQAAVAIVAAERTRQLEARGGPTDPEEAESKEPEP